MEFEIHQTLVNFYFIQHVQVINLINRAAVRPVAGHAGQTRLYHRLLHLHGLVGVDHSLRGLPNRGNISKSISSIIDNYGF